MKNTNKKTDAVEILGCYKGKMSTILFKKRVKDGFDRDIPLITIFNKVGKASTKRKNNLTTVTYDAFYQELHIEKQLRDRTEYITQYLDGMKVIDEKRYVIKRKGGD